jgi:hypothetical protein
MGSQQGNELAVLLFITSVRYGPGIPLVLHSHDSVLPVSFHRWGS